MSTIKKLFKISVGPAVLAGALLALHAGRADAALLNEAADTALPQTASLTALPGYQETKMSLEDLQEPARETDAAPLSLTAETSLIQAGTYYYVSPTGSDTNSGTSSSSALKSIQTAVSKLKAGDTLYILQGTYTATVDLKSSGTSSAYITIQGVGNVVINGNNPKSYFDPAFDTLGNDYIRFKNLTINNARYGVKINPGSHHIVIDGLKTDKSHFAVWMRDASYVTIRNAVVLNARNAFRGEGTAHDVFFENIETYYSKEGSVQSDGFLNGDGFIFENYTYNLTFRNIKTAYNSDAGMDIKGSNVLIENLISHHNTNGLKLWGKNVTVRNALIYDQVNQISPTGRLTTAVGINVRSGSTRVFNSTLYNNPETDLKPTYGASLYLENSIVTRSLSTGKLYTALGSFTYKYVNWYRYGKSTPDFSIPSGSKWADPKFVNLGARDFRLQSGSPAAGKGFNYSWSTSNTTLAMALLASPVYGEPPADFETDVWAQTYDASISEGLDPHAGPESPLSLIGVLNTQRYTETSGSVHRYGSDVLGLWGGRAVSYDFRVTDDEEHFMKISSAQITRKDVPDPGYAFNVRVYVNGQRLEDYDLPAAKEFAESGLIWLGRLGAGIHTVTLEWLNDTVLSSNLDSNLGLRDLKILRTNPSL